MNKKMKDNSNKSNYWIYGFFILLGILIGIIYNYYMYDVDERVITREVIEGIDKIIEYKEAGKFEEARVLGDSLNIGLWYLRNSNFIRTKFYDDLEPWFLGVRSIQELREIQEKLCPRSDLSKSYMEKEHPSEELYINQRARC